LVRFRYQKRVIWPWRSVTAIIVGSLMLSYSALGQIDPVKRDLLQVGYNASFEGHAPLAAYAYFYHNQPNFFETNLTLRLAIAPTYLDSELGISEILGPHTDLGFGLAGGGFADTYHEIRDGQYDTDESFDGHGIETSLHLYHLFNPDQLIPLNGVLHLIAHYSFFDKMDETSPKFELPPDHGTFLLRSGLRWGGKEPVLYPSLAMEISVWYQGEYRTQHGGYGYPEAVDPAGHHTLNEYSHLFWGQALIAYTLPEWKHNIFLTLSAGTSINADRFSAYRLGSLLPMVSEFPLSLPGYYYQELSARNYLLIGGNYQVPLDANQRWSVNVTASTALIGFLPGTEEPGNWHSGVGGGVLYKTGSFKFMVGYAYGVNAIRSHGTGANSVGVLMQMDMGKAKAEVFNPSVPSHWQGLQRVFGLFGS
jgi:hypothetical protein